MPKEAPARKENRSSGSRTLGLCLIVGGAGLMIYTLGSVRSTLSSDEFLFRATMAFVIGGIGITLLLFGPEGKRGPELVESLMERHPEKPWLWREDWAEGFARSEVLSQARTMALAGSICLLLSLPLCLQLAHEVRERRNRLALVGLVFPIAGLFMAGQSILLTLRGRKFARLRFEPAAMPGILGGQLTGRIAGEYRLPGDTPVELTLSCVHSYTSRSDSDGTRWQRVLWQDEKTVTALTGGLVTYIPVEFTIPYDCRATSGQDTDDEVLWRLSAHSNIPGLDLRSTFTLPVFLAAASDPGLTVAHLDASAQSAHSGRKPPGTKIRGGNGRFYLPPARNKSIAAALTVFGLLSLGSGLFFSYLLNQGLGWLAALMPLVVIGGLGALLLLFSASLWFSATTLELANREMRVRTGWLGLGRSRIVKATDISRLELHSSMQRGDQVFYDLRIHLINGRRVTAGSGLGRKEAEWLAGEVRKELGLPST